MASQATDNSSTKRARWYAPSVAKLLAAILILQAVLYLSAYYRWFWINEHKGFTVLVAVVATAALLLLLSIWMVGSRFFGAKTQFGLATLLLMVAVVGIPCGWLAREIEQARRQRMALEALKVNEADYMQQMKIAMGLEEARSPGVGWLRKNLGEEFFEEKTSLRIHDVAEDDLAYLSQLPELKELSMLSDSITDKGLAHLKGCPQLQKLSLSWPHITKAGWSHLQGVVRLRELDITGATVADAELEQIAKLSHLKILRITASSVNDDGVKYLKGLEELEGLALITSDITDTGLKHLKEIKRLKSLSLAGNKVTDAGLKHLAEHAGLKWISLNETWISKEGVEALKQALPNCEVQNDPLMTYGRLLD